MTDYKTKQVELLARSRDFESWRRKDGSYIIIEYTQGELKSNIYDEHLFNNEGKYTTTIKHN